LLFLNCRRNLEGETSPQNCPQTIQQHQQVEGIQRDSEQYDPQQTAADLSGYPEFHSWRE